MDSIIVPPSMVFLFICFGFPKIVMVPPTLILASTNSEALTSASPPVVIETVDCEVCKFSASKIPPVPIVTSWLNAFPESLIIPPVTALISAFWTSIFSWISAPSLVVISIGQKWLSH